MSTDRYTRLDVFLMIALGLLALAATISMAWFISERVPHLEDEIAYLFQARTFARGALWAPPPPIHSAFFVPFTLIFDDKWLGKYTIGWPLVLALGERLGAGWLVNPVIGALTVALVYALGRDLYNRRIGLLAGLLALSSPFFLIQSSIFMSHASACLWLTLLMWAWLHLDAARDSGRYGMAWSMLGGFALGMLTLTRPLTAFASALPFAVALAARAGQGRTRFLRAIRTYGPLVIVAGMVAALQPLYLTLTTGSPTTNLYTLIWPYDRLGFGPDIGPYGGHTLRQAVINTRQGLHLWASELFGWPHMSWVPLVLGLIFGIRQSQQGHREWPFLLAGPFVGLVVIHMAYWIGAQVYGPRYYYEGHAGLAILAALGLDGAVRLVISLVGRLFKRAITASPGAPTDAFSLSSNWPVFALLAGLIALNATCYLPTRLEEWHGLYNITREPLDRLMMLRESDRVLVLVRGRRWVEYAAFFSLDSPWLDDPILAAHDISPNLTAAIIALYPDREVWYYNGEEFSRLPSPYNSQSQSP